MGDKLDGLANLSSVYTREQFSHFQALPDHLSQDQAGREGGVAGKRKMRMSVEQFCTLFPISHYELLPSLDSEL